MSKSTIATNKMAPNRHCYFKIIQYLYISIALVATISFWTSLRSLQTKEDNYDSISLSATELGSKSECEAVCPTFLSCLNFKLCAGDHSDLCGHLIYFCRNQTDSIENPTDLMTLSEFKFLGVISYLKLMVFVSSLASLIMVSAVIMTLHRYYTLRQLDVAALNQLANSRTRKPLKQQKALKLIPISQNGRSLVCLCSFVDENLKKGGAKEAKGAKEKAEAGKGKGKGGDVSEIV